MDMILQTETPPLHRDATGALRIGQSHPQTDSDSRHCAASSQRFVYTIRFDDIARRFSHHAVRSIKGSQPAGMLVFIAVVLVLIVLYVLAARRLLFNAASA